eukprot:SAG22_NODE_176_length_16162_cov_30.625910_2_plen_140_part_00
MPLSAAAGGTSGGIGYMPPTAESAAAKQASATAEQRAQLPFPFTSRDIPTGGAAAAAVLAAAAAAVVAAADDMSDTNEQDPASADAPPSTDALNLFVPPAGVTRDVSASTESTAEGDDIAISNLRRSSRARGKKRPVGA